MQPVASTPRNDPVEPQPTTAALADYLHELTRDKLWGRRVAGYGGVRDGLGRLRQQLRIDDDRRWEEIHVDAVAALLQDLAGDVREAIVARDLSPTVHEWRKRQTEVIAAWNRLSHQLDRFVESVLPPDPPKTKQF